MDCITRTQERNEIAKELYFRYGETMTVEEVTNRANKMMSAMYGNNWNEKSTMRETTSVVSIAEQDGQKGVRFCIGDVDMFIEAHDIDDGKESKWPDAMKRLKEIGKETFSHKQGLLMAAYIDEINAALREIGGDELKDYYWTSTEYNTYSAWYVNFTNGYVSGYGYYKYGSLAVRACAAFKH